MDELIGDEQSDEDKGTGTGGVVGGWILVWQECQGLSSQVKMSLDDYRDVMIDLVEYGVGMTTT